MGLSTEPWRVHEAVGLDCYHRHLIAIVTHSREYLAEKQRGRIISDLEMECNKRDYFFIFHLSQQYVESIYISIVMSNAPFVKFTSTI